MFSFRKKKELDAIDSRINNFPDWMPAVLVKELRQGLRTRGFAIALIASQAVLFLILLASLASDSPQAAGQMINGAIFVVFGILTLFIQPLRGINAITSDIKSKTLELMQLTRMNSSRVVMGKWISLYTQTLLFAVTIIPYFVLRYFFGGMSISVTGGIFLSMLVLSGFLSAISVGLSANKSIIIRGLFVLIGLFGFLFFSASYVQMRVFGGSVTRGPLIFDDWGGLWLSVITATYVSYLFLVLGAAMIAPISENRQTRLRLVSFAFLGICALLCWILDAEFSAFLAVALMISTGFLFLSSYLFVTPNTSKKFLSKGPLGKAAGRLLYPGWPSGYLAFLVMSIGLILVCGHSNQLTDQTDFFIIFCFLGAISLSLILVELIVPKTFSRFAVMMIMLISQAFILFIATLLNSILNVDEILLFASIIPLCQLGALSEWGFQTVQTTGFIVNSVYVLLACGFAVRRFGYYREVEESVEQSQSPS